MIKERISLIPVSAINFIDLINYIDTNNNIIVNFNKELYQIILKEDIKNIDRIYDILSKYININNLICDIQCLFKDIYYFFGDIVIDDTYYVIANKYLNNNLNISESLKDEEYIKNFAVYIIYGLVQSHNEYVIHQNNKEIKIQPFSKELYDSNMFDSHIFGEFVNHSFPIINISIPTYKKIIKNINLKKDRRINLWLLYNETINDKLCLKTILLHTLGLSEMIISYLNKNTLDNLEYIENKMNEVCNDNHTEITKNDIIIVVDIWLSIIEFSYLTFGEENTI